MKYTKLGRTGLDVSRLCLGCMSYGEPDRGAPSVDARRGGEPAVHPAARSTLGINFFDTANVYSDGTQRGDRRPRAARLRAARRGRHRDQGQPAGCARARTARACRARRSSHEIDASLRAPRHRLRRPLPDPPLGPRDADRGDARGAARRRQGRQGALHRRVVDVRLAVREGAARRRARTAGRASSTMQNHFNLLYREEEREMLPLCRAEGIGVIPWSPLARGRLTRDWDARERARSETDEFGQHALREDRRRRSQGRRGASARSRRGAACRARRSRWPGCCASPASRAPIVGATQLEHLDDAVAALDARR